ncbi:MAG: A/G-specific adenine glycosylase [Pseudomonadota bacterium]
MSVDQKTIAPRVLTWFDEHGRKDLPWQQNKTHYRVWVSEIMLQQTQVASVIGYYRRFMTRFPTLEALAQADIDEVLGLWSGLGYYARARNLHKCARLIQNEMAGCFPDTVDEMQALPGIGRSTAAAILALVDDRRCAILDGNVKRVLARHETIGGWPGKSAVLNALWEVAEAYTPDVRVADYTQAMMDLGATVCTRSRPRCDVCPLSQSCRAYSAGTMDAYPGKKPKKVNPKRQTRFLILRRRDGALYLERRPSTGIWGGLFCFPEFEGDPPLPAGFKRVDSFSMATFVHKFTHFDLTIASLLVDGDIAAEHAAEGDHRWFLPDELASVGVPRPVERLVKSLQSSHPLEGRLL